MRFTLPIALLTGSQVLFGCAAKPQPKTAAGINMVTVQAEQPGMGLPGTGAPDAAADPRDLLAQKAAAYVKAMEAALAAREPGHPRPLGPVNPGAEIAEPDPNPEPQPAAVVLPAEPAANPAVAQQPVKPGFTNEPEALPPVNTDQLFQKLEQRTKDFPNDLAVQLDYQLLKFLRDEKVPLVAEVADMSAEDRELLSALLDSLSNFRNGLRRDNNMLLSRKIQPLMELATRLRSQAELTLPTIALCTKVRGFGVYEPVDPQFPAGREQPLIVYCEVANFSSQSTDQKQWETRLKQDVVLYTEAGLPVWQSKTKTVTDVSRNRRHDFYVVEMIRLPANLTIGRYLLKVTVVDENARRVAEATVPIKMVAGGGLENK